MARLAALALVATVAAGPALAQAGGNGNVDPGGAEPTATQGTGGDPLADAKAASEARTAAYNAAKAEAEARKAMIEAQAAAARAPFAIAGTPPTAPTGSVKLNEGSAKPEAMLLVTRSSTQAAREMAGQLGDLSRTFPNRQLVVLTDLSQLSTSSALQFDVQLGVVEAALDLAISEHRSAMASVNPPRTITGGRDRFGGELAAAQALIGGVAQIGSLFQSDYEFGGINLTEQSNLTAAASAAALRAANPTLRLVVPSNLIASDAAPVVALLQPLQRKYVQIVGYEASSKAAADAAAAPASKALLTSSNATSAKAIALYEAFMSGLTSGTAGQEVPIVKVVREKLVQAHLNASTPPMVLLVTSQQAAAYYSRKNLWTFLGGPPLYTMGGVSLVYSLFDPSTGAVAQAGAIAKHGGYRSVGAVERMFR